MELGERVLFVHAHPDDETLATGAAIATIADDGGTAGVVTLTLGERGEVTPAARAAVDAEGLAAVRARELDAAIAALGAERVDPVRRHLDSGMAWGADGRATTAEDVHADALTSRSVDEVAAIVTAAIEAFVPSAIVTYDADGGYGHPDHERVHAATLRAATPYAIPVYVRSRASADVAIPMAPVAERVRAALDAHRSQLRRDGDVIEHVGGQRERLETIEHYRLVATRPRLGALTVGLIAVVGAVVGVVGTFAHQSLPPWGVTIAILGAAGVIAGPRLLGSRAGSVAGALGVLGIIAIVALDPLGRGAISADGGIVPANPAGWAWAIVPAAIAVVTVGWPSRESLQRIRAAASDEAPRA